jgi:signal transduction histidine kinase
MRGVEPEQGLSWGTLAVPSVLAAAHELKAPLVLLRQLTYQLEQAGDLTSEQKLVQERIRLTTERTLRLVENITQTGRLDETLFALQPLEAHSVWQQVVSEINPLALHMDQELKLVLPKRPLLAVGHAELLPAVLLGLCDNALAHNPRGADVTLGANLRRGSIIFSVRDHGPRIDHTAFEQLETRLGKSPQPLGVRPNSSGLGLWIAGNFAKAMSATLSVTRHHRGGMTFSLVLPSSGQLSLL